ncbi:MAG: Na+/H+ antiporter subunit B [Chitinophagales bacterium]
MNSFILTATARWIVPVMCLFSIYLLFRGHNLPGGGFVGGLTAGAAIVLYAFARGVDYVNNRLHLNPFAITASGLLIAFASGMIAVFKGEIFLKGIWLDWEIPFIPKLGTPFLFDIGVYVVVLGIVLLIIFPNIEND